VDSVICVIVEPRLSRLRHARVGVLRHCRWLGLTRTSTSPGTATKVASPAASHSPGNRAAKDAEETVTPPGGDHSPPLSSITSARRRSCRFTPPSSRPDRPPTAAQNCQRAASRKVTVPWAAPRRRARPTRQAMNGAHRRWRSQTMCRHVFVTPAKVSLCRTARSSVRSRSSSLAVAKCRSDDQGLDGGVAAAGTPQRDPERCEPSHAYLPRQASSMISDPANRVRRSSNQPSI
jgi:hypothetical protein